MKTTVAKLLIPLMSMSVAAAQDGDGGDRYAEKAEVADIDTSADTQPVLLIDRARLRFVGTPHAIVVVLLGCSRMPGDTEIAPVAVLGCGMADAAGRFFLRLPPVDVDDSDDGTTWKAILVQAVQLRPDGRVDASPIANLLRRPAAETLDLKVDHSLGSDYAVEAEISTTDSLPPQVHLHLGVRVPTTGYSLKFARRIDHGDRIEVHFELMEPNPDMRHLTVLETLRAFVDLGEASGAIELSVRKVAFAKPEKASDVLN